MIDEEILTRTLASIADEAGPPPPHSRPAERRATVARFGYLVASLVAAAGVVLAGFATVNAFVGRDDPRVIGRRDGVPEGMRGSLVASERVDGVRWFLTTYDAADGALLCTDFRLVGGPEPGAGGGCWEVRPGTLGLSFGGPPLDDERQTAYGWVPRATRRVEVTTRAGATMRAQLHRPPRRSTSPVRFFTLVYAPRDVSRVSAFAADGKLIARRDVRNLDQRQPVGPVVLLAEGRFRGLPWSLHARASNLGPCHRFTLGADARYGSAYACNIGVPVKSLIGFTQHSFDRPRSFVAVYGAVPRDAASVTIEYPGGDTKQARIVTRPRRLPLPVDFFYVLVDARRGRLDGADLVARTRGGRMLARTDLCRRTLGTGSVCAN